VVPLLALGIALVAVALFPAFRRAPLLLATLGALGALAASSVTDDGFVVLASGALPVLAGFVLREITATFELLAEPRRAARRGWLDSRRQQERAQEARQRERRRREREQQRLAA
jgi:hypothetical protein